MFLYKVGVPPSGCTVVKYCWGHRREDTSMELPACSCRDQQCAGLIPMDTAPSRLGTCGPSEVTGPLTWTWMEPSHNLQLPSVSGVTDWDQTEGNRADMGMLMPEGLSVGG